MAILIVGVVAAVILGTVATLAWLSATARFTCPGVAWAIDYAGSDSGYLEKNPPTGCLGYPVRGPTGFDIVILLTLTSTAHSVSHQVNSITVTSPSSLNSISPALPLTLAPGGTANITLNVTIPTLTGDYVVNGAITSS